MHALVERGTSPPGRGRAARVRRAGLKLAEPASRLLLARASMLALHQERSRRGARRLSRIEVAGARGALGASATPRSAGGRWPRSCTGASADEARGPAARGRAARDRPRVGRRGSAIGGALRLVGLVGPPSTMRRSKPLEQARRAPAGPPPPGSRPRPRADRPGRGAAAARPAPPPDAPRAAAARASVSRAPAPPPRSALAETGPPGADRGGRSAAAPAVQRRRGADRQRAARRRVAAERPSATARSPRPSS